MLNWDRIAYLSIGLTLQKKILQPGLNNMPGIDFFDKMLKDFKSYKFIVIDSVSDQGMKRDTLRKIFESNPDKAFICVFHATKDGDARGGLDFKHDMDIILRIEQHRPLVEKNR